MNDRLELEEITAWFCGKETRVSFEDTKRIKALISALESARYEIERQRGLSKKWEEAYQRSERYRALAEADLARWKARAEAAWERMDRARFILRDPACGVLRNPPRDGRPENNWGILDTTLDRAAALEEKL